MVMQNPQARLGFVTLALAILGGAAGCASEAPPPAAASTQAQARGGVERGEIDPRAVNTLKRMCTYLTGLKQFSLRSRSTLDLVATSGEKLQYGGVSDVIVQRPNRLRSNRVGDLTDLEFYYDGATAVLYDKGKKVYATAPEPPTIDGMLDAVRTRLGVEPPGADLLYSDVCQQMLADVTKAMYLGESAKDGVRTHHLAFRAPDVDWQIWIEEGDRPLPRKYLITSRDMPTAPQFGVELDNWHLSPAITDATFKFTPPPGATKIEFLPRAQAPSK